MRVLLIAYDNDSYISYFPLGLAYIASALKSIGYEVEIYEQNIYHYTEEELVDYLNHNHFDAVGVGGCGGYYQYRKIKKIALAINEVKNKPFFWMGGHLPSPEPEYFLRNFKADAIVIGEGEETCKELLEAVRTKQDFRQIKGIAYIDENDAFVQTERRELIKDVDSILFPAWDLFTMEHYVLYPRPNASRSDRRLQMLSGRGCPFHCNFCYRMDSGYRPRSVKSIIEEIIEIKERFRVNYIVFDDELLMSSVNRTMEIADAIIKNKLNIKFWCEGRLNYASQDTGGIEMLKKLKEAGCVFINYGIESMDNGALERMHKNLTTEMIIKGIENTLAAGISPGLNIIFGNLDEDRSVLEKDVEFLLKYDDGAQIRTIRPVTPYPGTELYNIARERGLIQDIGDFYENKHTNSDLLTCNFTKLTDEEFYEALDWANGVLLDNYMKKQQERNKFCLTDLYKKHNSEFRGFRPV